MTMDAAPAPDEPATAGSAPVLVCATSVEAGRLALDQTERLFGSAGRADAESPMLGADVRAICGAVGERGAIAVVLGIDVGEGDRPVSSFVQRLVRRCPCPVIVVAVDGTVGDQTSPAPVATRR